MQILDLREMEVINASDPLKCAVHSVYAGKTSKDQPFVNVTLRDKSGTLDLMYWDTEKSQIDLKPGDVVMLSAGVISIYKNTLQLKNFNYEKLDESAIHYLPSISDSEMETLLARLDVFISLTDPPYRQLLEEIFHNDSFMAKFTQAPAAIRHHNSQLGGLLEHTIQVTQKVQMLIEPYMDMSLAITAALLHDVGKIEEYSFVNTISMTKLALVGHIVLGLQFVPKVINKLKKVDGVQFSDEQYALLLHCIASHQGKKEWGSPIEPMVPEAYILALADQAVSWFDSYKHEIQGINDGESGYSNGLKRFIYRKIDSGDPLDLTVSELNRSGLEF